MKRSALLVVLCFILIVNYAFATEDILVADFEGDDYGNWKVEGQAFGTGPAKGTLPGQQRVSRFEGEGLVNTFYKGDKTVGTLTSPLFEIQRKYINFIIGGGKKTGKACMNLLVNGKVVRTATGNNDKGHGSEAMNWASWDVGQFKGKQAVIQIVDQEKGSWGHITVDQIIQSYRNKSIREMTFTKNNYGQEPDYWVWLDIHEFRGMKATLQIDVLRTMSPNVLSAIYQDNEVKEADTIYKEKNRQQFHLSSKRGWNNDSNGLVYYKGEYHLFWQHNPYGWNWGNMTWGHAVSTDCVNWIEIGDAIHPDEMGTIYSGSAVVDHDNTAGFQSGDEKAIVCFYTSSGGTNALSKGQPYTQSIAYSNDRGRTWTKYKGNPVVKHIKGSNRDPKVLWHEPTKRWVMVLYLDDKIMAFLSSPDLKNWTKNSELKCFHECPELFKLAIDGDESNSKWVLYGGRADYYIGDFDGKKYTPQSERIVINRGNCFYASQTFSDIPESDGRRIQIAWGRTKTPGMPFNQCLLFPVNLTLRTTDQGVRMCAEPIAEIKNIHRKKHSWENKTINPGQNFVPDLAGELFHIRGTFEVNSAAKMSFNIRGTEILYDAAKEEIFCKGRPGKVKLQNGKIVLEILVDRNSIEIFGNNGLMYMPIAGILPEDNKTLKLSAKTAGIKVDLLEIYELNSIWK